MNLSGLKAKIQKLDASLPRRKTHLLPGEAFFSRQIDLPDGIAPADIPGFAQLQLEAGAPFPIDNLAWGFITDGVGKMLVFAGIPDRVYAGHSESPETLWHAFPSFLPLCLAPAPAEDCVVIGIAGGTASALSFKSGSAIPFQVASIRLPGDWNDAAPQAAQKLAGLLGITASQKILPEIRRVEGSPLEGDSRVTFNISGGSARPFAAVLSGDALWNADIRGRTFADSERRLRRTGCLAWKAFAAACVFAALLLVAALGLVAIKITTGVLHSGIRSRATQVEALQDKADFASNLESVTERVMKPFSMLATANAGRPEGVIFEKVNSTAWNVLHIEGIAQRSDLVQSYIEDLGKNPSIREVKTNRTASTGGRASFDIEITFNPLEDLAAE